MTLKCHLEYKEVLKLRINLFKLTEQYSQSDLQIKLTTGESSE